jgi:Mg/Co/Ni transporter MgtE
MPRKVSSREPLDAVVGLIAGAIWGATLGLGVCMWLLPTTMLFPGDTMVFGATVFAVLGYFKGDDFFRWIRDHWFDI